MNILIVMDSFKGSVTSLEAGEAIKLGIEAASKEDTSIKIIPIADGGEGTVEAFLYQTNGQMKEAKVTGLFPNQEVMAKYGELDGEVYLEVAETSGITLVPVEELNPWLATSYGLGELIRLKMAEGYRKFVIGLGGSGCNDAGVGMLQALGFRFLDKKNQELKAGIKEMNQLESIDTSQVIPELALCQFKIASDVDNPLLGHLGATAIYGPQKGVKQEDLSRFDECFKQIAQVTQKTLSKDFSTISGAGAAGGLGFAILAFLNGEMASGFSMLAERKGLDVLVNEADLIITGEGRLDAQSTMGKVPGAIGKIADRFNKPVIAIAGSVSEDVGLTNQHGIDAFFPIIRRIASAETIMSREETRNSLEQTAEQLFRFYQLARTIRK